MAYNDLRMDNQWLPFTPNRIFAKDPRIFVAADGMHFTTHDGRQVIDGISSLWCVGAGHNRKPINEAIKKQLDTLDYATAYADPNYYFGYDSAKFRGLVATLAATSDPREKSRLWRDIQRQLADDAVNAFLWNPAQVAVFKRGLRGLWNSSPIFANDMAAVSWAPPATKP